MRRMKRLGMLSSSILQEMRVIISIQRALKKRDTMLDLLTRGKLPLKGMRIRILKSSRFLKIGSLQMRGLL